MEFRLETWMEKSKKKKKETGAVWLLESLQGNKIIIKKKPLADLHGVAATSPNMVQPLPDPHHPPIMLCRLCPHRTHLIAADILFLFCSTTWQRAVGHFAGTLLLMFLKCWDMIAVEVAVAAALHQAAERPLKPS